MDKIETNDICSQLTKVLQIIQLEQYANTINDRQRMTLETAFVLLDDVRGRLEQTLNTNWLNSTGYKQKGTFK